MPTINNRNSNAMAMSQKRTTWLPLSHFWLSHLKVMLAWQVMDASLAMISMIITIYQEFPWIHQISPLSLWITLPLAVWEKRSRSTPRLTLSIRHLRHMRLRVAYWTVTATTTVLPFPRTACKLTFLFCVFNVQSLIWYLSVSFSLYDQYGQPIPGLPMDEMYPASGYMEALHQQPPQHQHHQHHQTCPMAVNAAVHHPTSTNYAPVSNHHHGGLMETFDSRIEAYHALAAGSHYPDSPQGIPLRDSSETSTASEM